MPALGPTSLRPDGPGADLVRSLPRPVGFVLGGGGSLGASQVGMLAALADAGVEPDLVTGTSVGSLNGAVLADADGIDAAVNRLARLWTAMGRGDVFPGGLLRRLVTLRREKTHVFANDGLIAFLNREIGPRRIEDLRLPFAAVAFDTQRLEPVALRKGPVVPALVASSAVPGLYPPVHHEGMVLYDGALGAQLPVLQALDMGAASLVVLDCTFPGHQLETPRNFVEVLAYSALVVGKQLVSADLTVAAEKVPVVVLPGPPPRLVSPIEFDQSIALMRLAYEASTAFVDGLDVDGPGLYGVLRAVPE